MRAWLNEGRQAQSYRWRADRVRTPLEKNVRWLRDAYAPTAYFIDVWSSIGPYDYWTADGAFQDRISTRNTWGEAFAWIRDCLGDNAPQISESGHDQLIGWLDGARPTISAWMFLRKATMAGPCGRSAAAMRSASRGSMRPIMIGLCCTAPATSRAMRPDSIAACTASTAMTTSQPRC